MNDEGDRGARAQRLVLLRSYAGRHVAGASFRDVRLEHVHFDSARLSGCDFEGATVLRSSWTGAVIEDTSFRGARLWDNVFDGARFVRCCFEGAKIQRADYVLDLATARGTHFESCRFAGANMDGQRVDGASFIACELDALAVPPLPGPGTVAPGELLEQWRPQADPPARLLGDAMHAPLPARRIGVTPGRGGDQVKAVAFRPDGALLATSSARAIRLWEVATWRLVLTLPVGANDLCWDGTGTYLAAAGFDGAAWLWHVSELRCVRRWPYDDRHLMAIALSSDGARLAAGGSSKVIRLLEVDGVEVARIERAGSISALAFQPGGWLLASASWNDDLVLLSDERGRAVRELSFGRPPDGVTALAFAPNGSVIASAGERSAALWTVADGRRVGGQAPSKGRTYALAFDPAGERLFYGTTDFGPTLHVARVGGAPEAMALRGNTVYALSMDPHGERLAIGASSDSPRVLGLSATADLKLGSNVAKPLGAAFSPCGRWLVVGYARSSRGRPRVDVFQLSDGARVKSFTVELGELLATGMTGAGEPIIVSSHALLCGGEVVCKLSGARVRANPGGGERVAVLGKGGLTIVNAASGERSELLLEQPLAAALSRDGTLAATSSVDGRIRLWDVLRGHCLGSLGNRRAIGYALAWSPDGRLVAAGDEEGCVTLWDIDSGAQRLRLSARKSIAQVLFSSDSRLLVVRAKYEQPFLWHIERDEVFSRIGDAGCVVHAFHPDGHVAVGHDADERLVVWEMPSGRERGFVVSGGDGRFIAVDSSDGSFCGEAVELVHRVDGLATAAFDDTTSSRRGEVVAGLFGALVG